MDALIYLFFMAGFFIGLFKNSSKIITERKLYRKKIYYHLNFVPLREIKFLIKNLFKFLSHRNLIIHDKFC